MKLKVTEFGAGEQLVVFVHGALGSGRSFDRVAALLDDEFRILYYDRRGYGENAQAAVGGPVGVDTHIDDLIEILDGRHAVVIGHSFGGLTTLGAAVRAPELVDALGAYETSMAWSPGWDDTVMRGVLAGPDPADAGLRLMLGERYDRMDDDERARRLVDAAAFAAEERSIRDRPPLYDVSEIRAPLVFGRSDPAVMPSVAAYLEENVPTMEIMELPGAGHHAHRSDPEGFARLTRRASELAASR
jgi:pimeloyl-ACP methyl ester carboxylesterase